MRATRRRGVRSTGLRIITGATVLLAAVTVVPFAAAAAQPPIPRMAASSTGALPHDGTTSTWIPSDAPMPTSLPTGLAPTSMTLYATSCSSSAFCLSVGEVFDAGNNVFPLVETYSGGAWTASVAPTPENSTTNQWFGAFYSVSCPADGQCAAVGNYYAYDTSVQGSLMSALLDNLSDGSWSTAEGAVPGGLEPGSVFDESVSCPSITSCSSAGFFDGDTSVGLLWQWGSGGWDMTELPLPPAYLTTANLMVNSISCADAEDCVAVGWYMDANYADHAMILTMTGGLWTVNDAPVPSNSIPPGSPGIRIPSMRLLAVDCPQVDYCVAGGQYTDTKLTIQPLLEIWDAGVWTAVEGPVPNASGSQSSAVEGMTCPAAGACIGTGEYGNVGMILSQSGATWSAADAPLPAIPFSQRDGAHAGASSTSSLQGVGCSAVGFCASAGAVGSSGLLEVGRLKGIPSLSSIYPNAAARGNIVILRGSGFTPSTSIRFGSIAATRIKYLDPDVVTAEVPSGVTCTVTVSFTDNGLTTRSSQGSLFKGSSCAAPGSATNVTAVPGNAEVRVSFAPPSKNGGAKITSYVVTARDELRPGRGHQTAIGTSSPITVKGLENGDVYSFTVSATNRVGAGPASGASNLVKPSPTI